MLHVFDYKVLISELEVQLVDLGRELQLIRLFQKLSHDLLVLFLIPSAVFHSFLHFSPGLPLGLPGPFIFPTQAIILLPGDG